MPDLWDRSLERLDTLSPKHHVITNFVKLIGYIKLQSTIRPVPLTSTFGRGWIELNIFYVFGSFLNPVYIISLVMHGGCSFTSHWLLSKIDLSRR